jgi:putative FmdB family regulatory protein
METRAVPLYEYRCKKCKHTFERIQKFSDNPEADCPECGGAGERQLSAPAVHFKGSGWYITDYARKGKEGGGKDKEAKTASTDKPKSSTSGDSSSSKKPTDSGKAKKT